jgi:hypothetical protein
VKKALDDPVLFRRVERDELLDTGAPVIDYRHRELIGWEPALRGGAKKAERAVEKACLR